MIVRAVGFEDIDRLIAVFRRAWLQINGDDPIDPVDALIGESLHKVPRAEGLLYWYGLDAHKIFVAEDVNTGEFYGILISRKVFEGVSSVRILYVDPEFQDKSVGLNLMRLSKPGHTVLFQVLKKRRPELLFQGVKNQKLTKIAEDSNFETWAMEWRE